MLVRVDLACTGYIGNLRRVFADKPEAGPAGATANVFCGWHDIYESNIVLLYGRCKNCCRFVGSCFTTEPAGNGCVGKDNNATSRKQPTWSRSVGASSVITREWYATLIPHSNSKLTLCRGSYNISSRS